LFCHCIGTKILEAQKHQGRRIDVIKKLSINLRCDFPDMKGFNTQNLKYILKFVEEFKADQQAVDQIPWDHIVTLIHSYCKMDGLVIFR